MTDKRPLDDDDISTDVEDAEPTAKRQAKQEDDAPAGVTLHGQNINANGLSRGVNDLSTVREPSFIWRIGLARFGINGLWAKIFFILCDYIPEECVTAKEWQLMGGKPIEDERGLLVAFLQRAPLLSLCANVFKSLHDMVETHAILPPSQENQLPRNLALEAQFDTLFTRITKTDILHQATALHMFAALHGAVVSPRYNSLSQPLSPYAQTDLWMLPFVRRVLKDLACDLRKAREDLEDSEDPAVIALQQVLEDDIGGFTSCQCDDLDDDEY